MTMSSIMSLILLYAFPCMPHVIMRNHPVRPRDFVQDHIILNASFTKAKKSTPVLTELLNWQTSTALNSMWTQKASCCHAIILNTSTWFCRGNLFGKQSGTFFCWQQVRTAHPFLILTACQNACDLIFTFIRGILNVSNDVLSLDALKKRVHFPLALQDRLRPADGCTNYAIHYPLCQGVIIH